MKKLVVLIVVAAITTTLLSFVTSQKDPWPVPEKYQKMANPVKADAASLANGKALYVQHCQSCHGKKGKGDGPKAAQLDTDSGDFTKADFQDQTDGALYYKTYEGRKDMPSYKKKIPDPNDIWAVVNYMRTFK
ncbi:MAG TPA: c-type cytochrome [Flavisolibacter sp.]